MNVKRTIFLELVKNSTLLLIKSDITTLNKEEQLFQRYFKKTTLLSYTDIVNSNIVYDNIIDIDIIILNLDSNYNLQSSASIDKFLRSRKTENDALIVYVLNSEELYLSKQFKNSILFDKVIPNTDNEEILVEFFYLPLRMQSNIKELNIYIQQLENLDNFDEPIKIQSDIKTTNISNDRMNDIRFTKSENISASKFIETLDSNIIDKIELIIDKIDFFISITYDLEDSSDSDNSIQLINSLTPIISEVYKLIDSLLIFQIIARAFSNLNDFLTSITPQQIEDKDKKNQLCNMLLAIIKDLEQWINVIFIEHTTNDIHYFDASFSSNILEIENIFIDIEDNDDDLEFF